MSNNCKLLTLCIVMAALLVVPITSLAMPTVFPTGTTIYKPDKCFNGFTVLSNVRMGQNYDKENWGVPVYDMNGNMVHKWKGYLGFPPLILPGGRLLAGRIYDESTYVNNDVVTQVSFDGKEEWTFNKFEQIKLKDKNGKEFETWTSKQHHDMQRWPNPVGYYVPGLDGATKDARTLIHARGKGNDANQSIYEVDWQGNITWEWYSKDHVSENLRTAFRRTGEYNPDGSKKESESGKEAGDPTLGGNVVSYLGPNKWFDKGDERFNPENVLMDNYNDTMFIISRKTGKIVWQLGPDYSKIPQLRKLGIDLKDPFTGMGGYRGGMMHHSHMIPKGLPGEGNIIVFKNGGPYSLILEFDPITLELVWEYSGITIGYSEAHSLAHSFFSSAISSVQRLPNGNTMICEGDDGRIFEVTKELETVWEFINPVYDWPGLGWGQKVKPPKLTNQVYRAYRYPYSYIPQIPQPKEMPVTPPPNNVFRIKAGGDAGVETVKGGPDTKIEDRGQGPLPLKQYQSRI